jgi:hypothetical protein
MNWEMPKAATGDWVLFYAHLDAEPLPAVVTAASARTVSLAVFGAGGPVEKPSVHHVTDPGVKEFPDWRRYGFWEAKRNPTESILSERVSLLEKKVGIGPKA